MLPFLLLSLVLAEMRVIKNPNSSNLRMLHEGEAPKVILSFNKPISDEVLDKHWFKDCMSQLKVLNKIHIEVGEVTSCDVDEVIAEMEKDDDIALVEKDHEVHAFGVPNDQYYSYLYGMNKIQAPAAWDISTGCPSDVVIAVIDTGVDYNHSDLAANMWVNPGEIPGNGIDDDGNGYVDDVYGINAINNSGDPMDDNFHGTHCAGTVAARGGNGIGVAGVTHCAKIMACKFLSASGSGATSNALECVEYAIDMGAKISNNSWGGGGFSSALNNVLNQNPQHLFVAAAGNANQNHNSSPSYPCDLSRALCVASTDSNDNYSSFSDYGTAVDIAAPGSSIVSCYPNGVGNCNSNSCYAYSSGTSMACPHVAGLAGLLSSYRSDLSADEIRNAIKQNGDPVSGKQTETNTRINALKALQSVQMVAGCDGVAGSGTVDDACGVCGGDNSSCAGCDGVPNSGKVNDACGECDGDNSSCAGCDGVANSGKVNDACGVCDGDDSSCAGCDGVPNSGAVVDECGVCGGDGSSCATTTPAPACFTTTTRVQLIPGSRYSSENDGCANVETDICEGNRWYRLTFDDGYRNWYQFQDLQECTVPKCWEVGDSVRIAPGSRYDGETNACATMREKLCPEDWYKRITFTNGYRNWYQHQDLAECNAAEASNAKARNANSRDYRRSRKWRQARWSFIRAQRRANRKVRRARNAEKRWIRRYGIRQSQKWLKTLKRQRSSSVMDLFGLDQKMSKEDLAKAYKRSTGRKLNENSESSDDSNSLIV
jgi:hypothetical protein